MLHSLPGDWRLEQVEWAVLPGRRPRAAQYNAMHGPYGQQVRTELARVRIGEVAGFGWSAVTPREAQALLGATLGELFTPQGEVAPAFRALEYPLLDWLGQALRRPVWSLFAGEGLPAPRVPVYDTSLYFDELAEPGCSDARAVELLQQEVREGMEQGHRHFKIKVGRGGRYLPLEQGCRRDVQVILGVRQAAGPQSCLMIDANNAYNLNLAKWVLGETRQARLFWIEEPFYENDRLDLELAGWMRGQGLPTLLADGEGRCAAPMLLDWVEQGCLGVLQYDIREYGFCRWRQLGERLERLGVLAAPHNYGSPYGNYVTAQLCTCLPTLRFVEWDEAQTPGLDAGAYRLREGAVQLPPQPGFGLLLDLERFAHRVRQEGWQVAL